MADPAAAAPAAAVAAAAVPPAGGVLGALASLSAAIAEPLGVPPQAVSSTLAVVLAGLAALAAVPLSGLVFKGKRPAVSSKVVFLIVAYSICSSMLLILNKVAVTYVPAPSFILLCQLVTCAVFVRGLAAGGVVECERLEPAKARAFALIVFGFIGVLFSNVTTLKYVPVDTVICFRASTPLVIAVIEFFYLGRELPSARSWAALGGVFAGVAVYAAADVHFTPAGYFWLAIWYAFAVAEMVWVKKVVDSISMSTWSRAFYQNALATPPMLAIAACTGELGLALAGKGGPAGALAVAASCVAGIGMSYFSFALRAVISATSFSVIGNVCKVLTILVNMLMWDQHANAIGTTALLVCLGAGALYQQPPMRKGAVRKAADTGPPDEAAPGSKIAALRVGEKSAV